MGVGGDFGDPQDRFASKHELLAGSLLHGDGHQEACGSTGNHSRAGPPSTITVSSVPCIELTAPQILREASHELGDSALVEEYVEGREFYVGVLGNREPEALPPVEMDFSGLPPGAPHILGSAAKWSAGTPEYQGTRATLPDLPAELAARLQQTAVAAYRALRVRDYGRVDLRTEAGEVYVLEVNANCYLDPAGELAKAAAAAGLDYPRLVQRIVDLARERHSAGSPEAASSGSRAGSRPASRSSAPRSPGRRSPASRSRPRSAAGAAAPAAAPAALRASR